MKLKSLFITALLLLTGAIAANAQFQQPKAIDLWPKGAPHKSTDLKDTARIWVYQPQRVKATRRAVLVCPGGGYSMLAIDHEGKDWAAYFNRLGITAIILKYRMPHGNRFIPSEDAEQAMRIIRQHADEWNIDKNDIGIMGSSAGGHLASTVATHAKEDVRPNFQILFYPVISMAPGVTHKYSHNFLLGENPGKELEDLYSNHLQVSATTPPAWIALSQDDGLVPPKNSLDYAQSLMDHKVPVSLHLYLSGDHGWGIGEFFRYHSEMEMELTSWLQSLK